MSYCCIDIISSILIAPNHDTNNCSFYGINNFTFIESIQAEKVALETALYDKDQEVYIILSL